MHDSRSTSSHATQVIVPVPSAQERPCRVSLDLQPATVVVQGSFRFEQTLAQLTAGARRLDLTEHRLRPQHAAPKADSFLVWRATPAGCTVMQGAITLPKGGVLMLAGHGAHFKETVFAGGVVMCAGPEYSGTFRDCAFYECTLYAVHSARLALRGCRFHRCVPAVVASGAATIARFTSCLFRSCQTGLIVDRGASIALRATEILNSHVAVIADGAGSHAELQHTTVRLQSHAIATMLAAVMAGQGAHVSVRHCEFFATPIAVTASGQGTRVEMHSSHCEQYFQAIGLVKGARAALCDVHMSTAGTPNHDGDNSGVIQRAASVGRLTSGEGACPVLQMRRCSVLSAAAMGILVFGGGMADVMLSTLSCRTHTVQVTEDSHAWVRHGVIRAVELACRVAADTGALHAEGCVVKSDTGTCVDCAGGKFIADDCDMHGAFALPQPEGALVVLRKACLVMHRCRLGGGLFSVQADRSDVQIVSTNFVNTHMRGAAAVSSIRPLIQPSATTPLGIALPCALEVVDSNVDMRGGSVQGHVHGIVVMDGEAPSKRHVRLDGVRFEECAQAVAVGAAVSFEATSCEFLFSDEEGGAPEMAAGPEAASIAAYPVAVEVLLADSAVVRDCLFQGPWTGVAQHRDMDNGTASPLQIQNCVFKCAPQRIRPSIRIRGKVVVEGCRATGSLAGVLFQDGGDGTVRRCCFGPGCGSGVGLEEGARARVLDCVVRGGRQGVRASDRCQLAVQDCKCVGARQGLTAVGEGATVTAKRLTVEGGYVGVVAMGRRQAGAAKSELKLVDCIFGDVNCGVMLGHGMHASLLRCEVERAERGFAAKGMLDVKLRRSTMRACKTGIEVGQRPQHLTVDLEDGHGSKIVDVSESSRMADALRSHPGDVARVALEDVCVLQCGEGGLQVHPTGHVAAQRVQLSGCGISVVRTGERSRFVDCSVAEGHEPQFRVQRGEGRRAVLEREELPGVFLVPVAAMP